MAFIPENDLERALVAAVADPAAAPRFYELLLSAQLLVMGSAEGQEDARDPFRVAPGQNLKLEIGERDGRKFLPVFSSVARMQEWVKAETRYLAMTGRDLLETTRGAPVILNPGSSHGKELTPQQVAQLLDPTVPVPARPMTAIGEADYPMALVNALTVLFAARPEVVTAWMIQVTFADRAMEPHPLVGIEFAAQEGGGMAALMPEIQRVAEAQAPGIVFDVQRVDRHQPQGIASALLQVEPFYMRQPGPARPLH